MPLLMLGHLRFAQTATLENLLCLHHLVTARGHVIDDTLHRASHAGLFSLQVIAWLLLVGCILIDGT